MSYQEALNYLFSRLPMYQREGKSAYKKDLTNTHALLERLDNPHEKFKSVHIAGTNGKGTCAHGIAAILQTAGYKTGLYTSPHLKSFTERIRINGEEVDERFIIEFVSKIKPAIEEIAPSFFEITVAMAFQYFATQQVDLAVIETGLGGRLDSTNVITPEACLITNIGYDHMDMLGDTLEEIANEKAGIIKSGVPVVIGEYHDETFPVFARKAKQMGSRLVLDQKFGRNTSSTSLPYHKAKNEDGVFTLAKVLKELGWDIEHKDICKGYHELETLTGLKGRYQVISSKPPTVADVAHNVEGLSALFQYAKPPKGKRLHLIYGTVKDKDLTPIFKLFPSDAKLYWTQSGVPRSLKVEELCKTAEVHGLVGESHSNVNDALQSARENALPEDLIVVTGSTFVVAELEEL